jgi:hypothetical protein
MEEGCMPIREYGPRKRSWRLCALLVTCAALGVGALAAPTSASVWEEPFCPFVTLYSGQECFAQNRHTLQLVKGWSVGAYQRVCAASFSTPYSMQNSDWRCDYGYVEKWINGRVDGVGALHNGDQYPFIAAGFQSY